MSDGWERATLEEIAYTVSVRGHQAQTNEYGESGTWPIVDQGQERIVGYTDAYEPIREPLPLVIFGDHTRLVKLVGEPFVVGADGVKLLAPKTDKVEAHYLHVLVTVAAKQIPSLGYSRHFKELKEVVLPLPPLPEQRKIAEILRTWDEALEKLTALRVAKARRLRGLGRALLARAADDPATVSRPLSDLARIVKGQQLNKLDIAEGEYPVWNGGVTPSGFHDQWNTEGGTITISEGGNSCGFVSLADGRFWLGGHCYALQDLSNTVERDFLFHALKSREPEIMRLRVGSGLPNIQRADLERLPIMVPPLDMQERIARVLTAGNDEIALLDAEIAALTRQKRGLMQKLLTGAWRVCP